jgi:1-phosphofructokinase family hexose kinase
VLIATPNITVDRTVRLAELRPGSVQRPRRASATAGGKGVNVARTAAALGLRATLVGFAPDADATLLARLFAAEPLDFVGLPVEGEARVCTIYLEDSGRATVLNEPGPQLSAGDWARYERLVGAQLATGRYRTLVCDGSLPPGAPDDAYGRLTAIGHRAGVRVVVDAARAALAAALPFGPDVVTPNLAEAEGLLHDHADEADEPVADTAPDVPARACAAVRQLCRRGARSATVTAGAAGVAYGTADEVVWVRTIEVAVVNPIGAGDSFVGGLVAALEAGLTGAAAVVQAAATATASVEHPLGGGLDPARARELAALLSPAEPDEPAVLLGPAEAHEP